jgi:hypothetical protein
MAERKWGAITSGATFESLATTIVFFEDPAACLFGRPGKDGGQDARSGDGKRVFQAKHHKSGSAAAAIRDAKREAKKIEAYRKPGHARHAQWAGVTHWRLVTNAVFNPTDQQAWDTEVVPIFAEQRLDADYWEQAALDGLLDKHPEIHRSYFENEARVFLSIPEVRERLPSQEPFLRREDLGPFCGRTTEKRAIREFLASNKLFLVVHGAGGTGKTRLLVDAGGEIAGEGDWQVLWANAESMAATGSWFEAVVPERSTLLFVDEPADERVLQQLAEQLGGRVGRTAKWKVVVAVRSPKDPVLRFLRLARMKQRVQELALFPLPSADAEEMCFQLLETGMGADLSDEVKRKAARQLSQKFAHHPVWLTLAIQHLEDHGDLKQVPADAEALADEYLLEIEKSQNDVAPVLVRALLRWVALLGTVNRKDDSMLTLIGERCGLPSVVDVRERIAALVRRRALSERGAYNRFVEVKPDVLRDHVLLRWLATDTGGQHPEVSADAQELLETVREAASRGTLSELGRAILVSLARTEFILRLADHEFGLLRGFFASLEASVPMMSATQRVVLADILETVAHYQPGAAASLVRALRLSPAPDETVEGIFGPKVVGQADVVLTLAWPLFGAAMGAQSLDEQEAVLRELCTLTEAEAELAPSLPRGLPNDGQRAAALVTRVLEGGPQFWSEYDDTAKQLGVELLDELARQGPSRGQVALLDSLVRPLLDRERRQTWADDRSFTWRTFSIEPGGSAWLARETVLARLRENLRADAIPSESRRQLWRVFSRVRTGKALDELKWTHEVLTSRVPSIEELAAAREVWDWYRRYEKDPATKAAADALEDLYESNDLASEFQPLLPSLEDWQEHDGRASAKAAELALASSPNDIAAFLDRAASFLGSEQHLFRLGGVARSLGTHAESREVVRQFIRGGLKASPIDPRAEFVVAAAESWVAGVRIATPERAHVLVNELLDACGSDERRAHLLERFYSQVPRFREITAEERALLRNSRELFTSTSRDAAFVAALALSVGHDWPTLQPLLEDALAAVPAERLPLAMHALVDALYWAVREDANPKPPTDLGEWLMSQLLALPEMGDIGGNSDWYLTEILKRLGRPDVRWLPEALRRRQMQESFDGGAKSHAVRHNARVSKYVDPVDAAHASDAGVLGAIGRVLDFVTDEGTVGYYLPEILRDADPEGLVVPAAVAARTVSATDAESVRRLARIGGAYAGNSAPWRTIALATIRAAKILGAEPLRSVYGSLGERGVRSWSGAVGEVPQIFIAAVAEARAALDAEDQEDLLAYWQQRLGGAEAELRRQEEQAKEERGE